MASDEVLKQVGTSLDRFGEKLDRFGEKLDKFGEDMAHEHRENRRFHHELMKRMERWSISVEARMAELSEQINDQGDLIRAQTEALQRVLDRLPPATS